TGIFPLGTTHTLQIPTPTRPYTNSSKSRAEIPSKPAKRRTDTVPML
ncbi:hypothetical protein GWI33_010317, partial [Rhynchophorus ferrugineus]